MFYVNLSMPTAFLFRKYCVGLTDLKPNTEVEIPAGRDSLSAFEGSSWKHTRNCFSFSFYKAAFPTYQRNIKLTLQNTNPPAEQLTWQQARD